MSVETIENKKRGARILLVEDNPGDVMLTKKAFKSARMNNEILVAEDGETGLAMLNDMVKQEGCPLPDIILMDLNLPGKSGVELLQDIKTSPHFRHIPVIVLTSSKAETDVVKTYDLHANGYVVKPVNLEKFMEVVSSLEKFWFSVVILPDSTDIESNIA